MLRSFHLQIISRCKYSFRQPLRDNSRLFIRNGGVANIFQFSTMIGGKQYSMEQNTRINTPAVLRTHYFFPKNCVFTRHISSTATLHYAGKQDKLGETDGVDADSISKSPIEKVKQMLKKYKEEDEENEKILLRSIEEERERDRFSVERKQVVDDASSTDVDEIYRLKEEKEKKRLDSVQLIPQVAHKTVMRAMIGNSIITILKFLTYLRTGSPAMLSETVHTLVDTGNQAILLIGLREASKGSDDRHPYGYGRNAFFWALVSALGLFWCGCGVTVYHGVSEFLHPPKQLDVGLETWSILALSFGIDGWVLWKTVQDLLRTKPDNVSFVQVSSMPFYTKGSNTVQFLIFRHHSANIYIRVHI